MRFGHSPGLNLEVARVTKNPLVFFHIGSVPAQNPDFAGRGKQQPKQHLDGGRFTRSVWPQKTKNFTFLHVKRALLQANYVTIFLA